MTSPEPTQALLAEALMLTGRLLHAAETNEFAAAILAASPRLAAALSLGLRLLDENDPLLAEALGESDPGAPMGYTVEASRIRKFLTERLTAVSTESKGELE